MLFGMAEREKMVQVATRVPESLAERMYGFMAREERSAGWVLRRALESFLAVERASGEMTTEACAPAVPASSGAPDQPSAPAEQPVREYEPSLGLQARAEAWRQAGVRPAREFTPYPKQGKP